MGPQHIAKQKTHVTSRIFAQISSSTRSFVGKLAKDSLNLKERKNTQLKLGAVAVDGAKHIAQTANTLSESADHVCVLRNQSHFWLSEKFCIS